MRRQTHRPRSAFSLVELLMVIAIIGILAGLAVPALLFALKKGKAGAIAMEAQSIAQAIEAYKNKVGDYPPDGSNTDVFVRHYRKRFPQILSSEFAAVTAAVNSIAASPPHVMDPPEALVFALGGFSADPTKPFTGPGGPLFNSGTLAMPIWQYNTDRNEPLYEFKQTQLTLTVNASGLTVSTDEAVSGGTTDVMPCYVPSGKIAPFVYFDSRTYTYGASGGLFYNYYSCGDPAAPEHGVARPYRSDTVNTRVGAVSAANADNFYEFVNEKSFQLVSGGLDDNYGNVPFTGGAGPRYYRFPSGNSVDFGTPIPTVGSFSQFLDVAGDPNKFQQDNVANFAEGVLGDALKN